MQWSLTKPDITGLVANPETEPLEQTVRRTGPRTADLGQDPTQVLGLPIVMHNLTFDEAGQYAFYLLCDGERIAQEPVEVR